MALMSTKKFSSKTTTMNYFVFQWEFLTAESFFNGIREALSKMGNIVMETGKIFASREAKFCFHDKVSRGGQTGKHHRKHDVSKINVS